MCTITITSDAVFRVGPDLHVSGTVTGCVPDFDSGAMITVDFDCNGTVTSTLPEVSGSGIWFASVPAGDCKCVEPGQPDQMVTITVTCLHPADEDPCEPLEQALPLRCFDGCVLVTTEPGQDDVLTIDVDVACEPNGGPHALVTFTFFVENELPFNVTVNLGNPALVSVAPNPLPVVPAGTIQQVQLVARVLTPLNSPNDAFTLFFADASGAVIPCPGFTVTKPIPTSCCAPHPAPRVEFSTNGCTLTATWNPEDIDDDCYLHFGFNDPADDSDSESLPGESTKTHTYSANGNYGNLTVYVKCLNGCSGDPRIFGPIVITECDGGGGDPTPTEPESTACGATRLVAVVTGAMSLFVFIAAWCLGGSTLFWVAGVLAAVSALLWALYYWFSCDPPCGVAKLTAAETLIAAGLALLTYSACCTVLFLSVGAIFVLAGLALFYKWKEDCNIDNCFAVGELAALGAVVTSYLIIILDFIPGLSACKNPIISFLGQDITGSKIVLLITGSLFLVFKACVQAEATDDPVFTQDE